jgi:hypothetical protein
MFDLHILKHIFLFVNQQNSLELLGTLKRIFLSENQNTYNNHYHISPHKSLKLDCYKGLELKDNL